MTGKQNISIRIDNRLLHGQVVQFWIPYLKTEHLIIADDSAASNSSLKSIYKMAVPKKIDTSISKITQLKNAISQSNQNNILIVLCDIYDLARAVMTGFNFSKVTLGNIHSSKGRKRITDAVYLTQEEEMALLEWSRLGKKIEIQTFPGDVLLFHQSDHGGACWSRF